MKSDSDIGDNASIVLVVGGSLIFAGWLLKQGFDLVRDSLGQPLAPPARHDSLAVVCIALDRRSDND